MECCATVQTRRTFEKMSSGEGHRENDEFEVNDEFDDISAMSNFRENKLGRSGAPEAANSTKKTNLAKFCQSRTFEEMSSGEGYRENDEFDENDEFGEISPNSKF